MGVVALTRVQPPLSDQEIKLFPVLESRLGHWILILWPGAKQQTNNSSCSLSDQTWFFSSCLRCFLQHISCLELEMKVGLNWCEWVKLTNDVQLLLTAMNCSHGKVYESCGSPCLWTCENYLTSPICLSACMEGCFCPDETVEHGGECIPISHCGE